MSPLQSSVRFRWAGPVVVALLVAVGTAGCSTAPGAGVGAPAASTAAPASAETPSPSPTPTRSAAALTCTDLVPKSEIVQALAAGQPADDRVVLPVSTVDGSITGQKALEGAGGLGCSWRAGPPDAETGVATLTVSILPGAADEWTGALYGDGPTDQRRTFAGVSTAATCGDPGCGATAPVGSSWVRVDLMTPPREGASGTSAFAKETDDEVFADLKPAVETVFRTVQDASAAQLRFPDRVPADGAAPCTNYLKKVDLESALQVGRTRVTTDFPPDPKADSLFAAAELRLGDTICTVEDARYPSAEIAQVTVGPEQAWAVDEIAADPAQRGDLRPVRLEGLASGERALSNCAASSNGCVVLFTLGSTAIQIEDTPHGEQVAEAILAGAR